MTLGSKLLSLTDRIVRKMPAPITQLLSIPAAYGEKGHSPFLYESARVVNTAFAFCMNNKIKGDYAEFGCYQGATTTEAYLSAQRYAPDTRFHIFDSFEGLPETSGGAFHTGQFACTRDRFEANLRRFGVDLSRFTITEGFFDASLPPIKEKFPIAVAWVDCDLYDSTVPVLDFLTDRLVENSVLIFDDWYCVDGKGGEQRACTEWLERTDIRLTEYRKFHWAGNSFIVNKP